MASNKTITQRIAFEGGAEMKVQLSNIGEAGAVAFKRLKDAGDAASGFGARLIPVLDSIKQKLKDVGDAAGHAKEKISNMAESVRNVANRIALIATAAIAGATGFAMLVLGAGNAADEVGKAADAAGMGTTKFQNLRDALSILGAESGGVGRLIDKMNRTLGESQKQALETANKQRNLTEQFNQGKMTGEEYLKKQQEINREAREQVNVFNRLGVSAATAMDDPHEALLQFADALKVLPEGIEKSSLRAEIFGKTNRQLAQALNEGRDGLLKYEAEMQRIAPAFTTLEIAVGQKLHDAFEKLTLAATRAKDHFLLLFGPGLTQIIDAFTEMIVDNRDKLMAFGQEMLNTMQPILKDFVALLQNKEIDPAGFIAKIRDAVVKLGTDVKAALGIVVAAWNGFVAILDTVARGINAIFGTNISGQALAIVAVIGVLSGAFAAVAATISAVIAIVGVLDAVLVAAFGTGGALMIGLAALGFAIGFILGQVLPEAAQKAVAVMSEAISGTVQNFQEVFAFLGRAAQAAWDGIVLAAETAWNAITESVTSLAGGLAAIFGAVWGAITEGFRSAVDAVKGFFEDLGNTARGIFEGISGFIQSIISAAQSAASALAGILGGGGSGDGGGFARGGQVQAAGGGYIRGPGSTTSDSILGWLSDKEFIMKARAVQHYGISFMNRVNNMTLPKSLFEGFAGGGLVRALQSTLAMPAFAAGGPVAVPVVANGSAGGRPFVLQIGNELFGGMTAEDDTVDRLQRFATRRGLSSAGRKPSWVG